MLASIKWEREDLTGRECNRKGQKERERQNMHETCMGRERGTE